MSIKIMAHLWEHSQHSGSLLLLELAIADCANDDGIAWPGIERLAKKTRLSRRQTQRAIKKLAESHEIVIRPRFRNTHIYQFPGWKDGQHIGSSEGVMDVILKAETPSLFAQDSQGDTDDTLEKTRVTSEARRVTPMSPEGDMAVASDPSLTIIKASAIKDADASLPAPSKNGAKTDDITQPVDVSLARSSNGQGEPAEITPDHKSISDIPIQTSTTREIQDRYCELLGYKPDNWAEGESVAAKAIASLCTADEFEECYKHFKEQNFWKDKRLTLRHLRNEVQGYLIHTGKRAEKNGRKQNGRTIQACDTHGRDSSYAESVAKAVTIINQRNHAGVGEQSPLPVLRADQGTVPGAGAER